MILSLRSFVYQSLYFDEWAQLDQSQTVSLPSLKSDAKKDLLDAMLADIAAYSFVAL